MLRDWIADKLVLLATYIRTKDKTYCWTTMGYRRKIVDGVPVWQAYTEQVNPND